MRSDSLQQQVVLAVQSQPRDQSPFLVVPPAGSRRIMWSLIAIRLQMLQNTENRVPTVFREELLHQCFTQSSRNCAGIVLVQHSPSCTRSGQDTPRLVQQAPMMITKDRWLWPPTCLWTCRALDFVPSCVYRAPSQNLRRTSQKLFTVVGNR